MGLDGDEGAGAGSPGKARAGMRQGFPLCSSAFCCGAGAVVCGQSQVDGPEAPRVGSELTVPFKCVLSQHQHPCPRGEQCWNKKDLCRLSAHDGEWAAVGQPWTEVLAASEALPILGPAMAAPATSVSPLLLMANHFPQPLPTLSCCGATQRGLSVCFVLQAVVVLLL